MKIVLSSDFHNSSAELYYSTTNRRSIRLTGRQLRRLLSEICLIDGCDCVRSLTVALDGVKTDMQFFDPDADDDECAMEIALPKPV